MLPISSQINQSPHLIKYNDYKYSMNNYQQSEYSTAEQQFQQTNQLLLQTHHLYSHQQSLIYHINNLEPSGSQIFTIKDCPSPQYFMVFNQLLKNKDLAYFHKVWMENREEIVKNIYFILDVNYWLLFQFQFSQHLQMFIHLIDAKIRGTVMYSELFPQLQTLIKYIQRRLQIKADKKKAPKSQKPPASDILFQKYTQEIQSLSKRQGAFYIKGQNSQTKTPLGQFIADHSAYIGSNTWKEIYFITACSKRQEQFKNMRDNQQILDEKINRANFLSKMTDIKSDFRNNLVPASNRTCCAKLFYYNFDIYDRIANNCPILTGRKLKKLDQTNKEKDAQILQVMQVMYDIIALLNCGGGVILFNTVRNYLQIWPKGQSIIEADQDRYKKIIQDQIKIIQPPIKTKQQIFISFAPIVKNPYTLGCSMAQILYIKGLYVMRITVRPKNLQNFYYYSHGGNIITSSCIENQRRRVLKGKQLIKFYQNKLENTLLSKEEEQDEQIRLTLSKNVNYFYDHKKCVQPEKGFKAKERQVLESSATQNIKKYESEYKYLSLLVAHKSNYSEIKQKLKNKGTECQIVVKYAQYKFKAANNSAALYHNERFDRLLTEIAYNKQFQFNGRFILTILVTQYLKLPDRKQSNPFPQDQFFLLQKWLKGEHPNEQLTVWRYTNGQQVQFYMKTHSKISTLYMYYVLNQYNQKCIFKNPLNYEKMTAKQRDTLITLYYPQINRAKK